MFTPVSIRVRMCIDASVCVYIRKHTRTLETPRHTRVHTDTCVYVSMALRTCVFIHVRVREHALHTCVFIRMRARIYRCEYVCVCICTRVYAHVYAFSLSLSLSLSLSSLSLTFKLPGQFHELTFLPGGFVSFRF